METVFGPDREDPIDMDVATCQEMNEGQLVTLSFSQPCLRSESAVTQSNAIRCKSAPKSSLNNKQTNVKMSVKENFLRKSKSLAFHVADDEYSGETINYVGTGKDENLNHVRAEDTESSQPQTVDKAKYEAVFLPLDTTEILFDDEMTINAIAKLYDLETCDISQEQEENTFPKMMDMLDENDAKLALNHEELADISDEHCSHDDNHFELPGHPISPTEVRDEKSSIEPRVIVLDDNEEQHLKQWWTPLVSCFKRR